MAAHLLRKGKIALYDAAGANILAGLAYGALVYLSDTTGLFADAAGTVSVICGRVIPLWDDSTPTKILDTDLR
jgi:tetrahydromethanopterin S-methyltransferase subunit E